MGPHKEVSISISISLSLSIPVFTSKVWGHLEGSPLRFPLYFRVLGRFEASPGIEEYATHKENKHNPCMT